VTLIVDAGPLIALVDRRDPLQPVVERILGHEPGQVVVPAPVTAEVDYLLRKRLGRVAREGFFAELARGVLRIECLHPADYGLLVRYDRQYADLDVGLVDLSIVILARRFETRRILTFDERHFRALRPLDGGHFILLPRDLSINDR
jgi:predicted nucleic acid-binding protein